MPNNLSRRDLILKSIKIGTAALGAGLLGYGAYSFLKQDEIEDLYDTYPPAASVYPLKIADPNAPKPNIVYIMCDDLGYGDVGCNGGRVIRTPNIDALAATGTRFTDFYSCNAVCAPARAGLLTGRYPFRTGVIGNPFPKGEPVGRVMARKLGEALKGLGVMDTRENYAGMGLSSHEITLAEGLKKAGYRTGMVGKWHLGDYSKDPARNPLRHGFDKYFGVPHSNDMVPCPLFRDDEMLEEDIGENQARITGMYTEEALRFIDESGRGPFFLYLAHTFPHQPLYASERFLKKSAAGIFGDAVEEVDWSVGEIVKRLREKGLERNTLVIFTSDNGPWYEGSAGPFRGRKGQSYEGGFRVPFIASWPGRIPAGRVSGVPLMNLDILPTAFALAGVELPRDRVIDGKNVMNVLSGTDTAAPHEAIFFYHYDLLEGVRMGDWKYFDKVNRYVWPVSMDAASLADSLGKKQMGNRWPLLYDVKRDPGESYNVINTRPEVAEKLKAAMQDWAREAGKDPRGFNKG
ncbi:MAG: hypothetical protein EPN93_00200 [Spirochaetes bacterium]|nr:MAG: hypothetical protein EPN93_00200 [Spirochaetota bacterium]